MVDFTAKTVGGFTGVNFGSSPSLQMDLLSRNANANRGTIDAAMLASLDQARKRAAGEAPSLAQAQLLAGQEAAIRGATALAANNTGGNIGAAGAQASILGAGNMAATNQAAAQLRAEEDMANAAFLNQAANAAANNQLSIDQLMAGTGVALRGQDMDYDIAKKQQALAEKMAQYQRNQGWAQVGVGALGGLAGMVGGMG